MGSEMCIRDSPRPVGLAVFFPKALHCPACSFYGGENRTQAAVPDKDYGKNRIRQYPGMGHICAGIWNQ